MVHKVQAMFAEEGPQKTFAAIDDLRNTAFHDRDLYPFIYTTDGVNVAHGARPVLVGHNLMQIRDADGKYLIQDMVKLVSEHKCGWIDYKWPDPLTNKVEDKSSYIERMGVYLVGVGIYREDASRAPGSGKSEPSSHDGLSGPPGPSSATPPRR